MTLAEFLTARLDEDEAMARAAVDQRRPGTHWQWVTTETDTPVAPGDLAEALDHQAVSLRTVEEFPTGSVGPLPAVILRSVDEMEPSAAGGHIARWDPAWVLVEIEAKRRIIEMAAEADDLDSRVENEWGGSYDPKHSYGERMIRALAAVYADHPDFDPAWTLP